jgi:hypothetical protein
MAGDIGKVFKIYMETSMEPSVESPESPEQRKLKRTSSYYKLDVCQLGLGSEERKEEIKVKLINQPLDQDFREKLGRVLQDKLQESNCLMSNPPCYEGHSYNLPIEQEPLHRQAVEQYKAALKLFNGLMCQGEIVRQTEWIKLVRKDQWSNSEKRLLDAAYDVAITGYDPPPSEHWWQQCFPFLFCSERWSDDGASALVESGLEQGYTDDSSSAGGRRNPLLQEDSAGVSAGGFSPERNNHDSSVQPLPRADALDGSSPAGEGKINDASEFTEDAKKKIMEEYLEDLQKAPAEITSLYKLAFTAHVMQYCALYPKRDIKEIVPSARDRTNQGMHQFIAMFNNKRQQEQGMQQFMPWFNKKKGQAILNHGQL